MEPHPAVGQPLLMRLSARLHTVTGVMSTTFLSGYSIFSSRRGIDQHNVEVNCV